MSGDKRYFIAIEGARYSIVDRHTNQTLAYTDDLLLARDMRNHCNSTPEDVGVPASDFRSEARMINTTVRESFNVAHTQRVLEARRMRT